MKRFLLVTFCLTYVFTVFAGPVSEKQALEKALQFMPGKAFRLSNVDARNAKSGNENSPYYIFNMGDNEGFVIVSGDDRTKAILGYSENGSLNGTNPPENVTAWLDYYADVISSLGNDSQGSTDYTATSVARSNIAPLIKSTWSQYSPYNDQCVFDGTTCVTGCVATAMAQIINFHKYPSKVAAIDGYTNGYTVPALPAVTLSWKNMCDTYDWNDTRTDAQNKAVATLMRYCGQSVEMSYGSNGSSAVTGYASVALVKYFGYNKSTHVIYRDGYSEEGWENEIYQELAASYPILYSGRTTTNFGHAFIVDGYKDGLYHVNWGWGGWCDGYFVLTVMDSTGEGKADDTYSEDQYAIVGIRPTKGGTLDYPKMTISNLGLNSDKEITRESSNSNFNVSVSFKMQNSVNSDDDQVGLGFALYKGDEMVQSLAQSGISSQRPGMYWQGSWTFSFGSGLADGKYRIQAVYKDQDGIIHKAQGSDYRYIEATIKGNKLALTKYPLIGVVTLNESEVTIEKGRTVALKAAVTPLTMTDKKLTWESSDTRIATVTSEGIVKGVKAGTATITCTSSTGLSASCAVIVGYVSLNMSEIIINRGGTFVLSPTVKPTSLLDKTVSWKSSDETIVTVNKEGKIKGVKDGTATITCTSIVTGLCAICEVTVGNINLSSSNLTIQKGKTVILKATVSPATLPDKNVTWESSDTRIATVTKGGKVKGVKAGTTTITCTSVVTGLCATCKVTVGYVSLNASDIIVERGRSVVLTPTVKPTSLSDKTVMWKSSDETIVTVTKTGKVKAVKAGKATITCTSVATGLSTACTVTVGYVSLNASEVTVQKGKTFVLTPIVKPKTLTDKSVIWESSNNNVVSVTSEGLLKGVRAGIATVTCTSVATGLSTSSTVTVGYVSLSTYKICISEGKSVVIVPTVKPSVLSDKSVKWESSDEGVAMVTSGGKVIGVKAGIASITCTSVATGLSVSCKVTVASSSGTRSFAGNDEEIISIGKMAEDVLEPYDVYDLSGHKLLNQVTSLDGLPNGIYIVNGRKVLKKSSKGM